MVDAVWQVFFDDDLYAYAIVVQLLFDFYFLC